MATKKFAGPSPYTLAPSYPKEDYLHTNFLDNVTMNLNSKSQAEPVVGALFGLGRIGVIHYQHLRVNPRINLKYIVDDRPERFEDFKKYWSVSDKTTFLSPKDSDRVFKDKEVKVVIVGTPTFTHHDIVVKAIANDKDVFCEKPVSENTQLTKECYDIAKAKGRILFAAFHRRFDPAYRGLREKTRAGVVGHIQILKVTSRDSPLPGIDYLKNSGGIFHDSMVHDFDMSCWVMGELPIRVQATGSALMPEVKAIDDFDTVAYLLTFPSGAVVLGDNSRYSAYGHDQRLEVFGAKGMVKVENERPCHSTEVILGHEGVKNTPIYYSFPSRYKLAYFHEMNRFLDIVQFGAPLEVTELQNLAVSKIATAVEKSARTGQSVELEWSQEFRDAFDKN